MDEREIAALARLHTTCLTDSLVTAMGAAYVRAFYRYVSRSPREFVLTERAGDKIVAAAVISLEPATFNRRLLLHTPLIPKLATRGFALLGEWWRASRGGNPTSAQPVTGATAGLPEMLLIYTAPHARGSGHGRALLREVDARLGALGIHAYQVRTELEASNRALRFYDGNGFARAGISMRLGKRFQVFVRTL